MFYQSVSCGHNAVFRMQLIYHRSLNCSSEFDFGFVIKATFYFFFHIHIWGSRGIQIVLHGWQAAYTNSTSHLPYGTVPCSSIQPMIVHTHRTMCPIGCQLRNRGCREGVGSWTVTGHGAVWRGADMILPGRCAPHVC